MKQFYLSPQEKINLEASICKDSLYEFVKRSWHIIEAGVKFSDNWHIQLLCDALEKTYQGEIRNLAINIPPRCMKSTLVSICFPAWVMAKEPTKKFLCISYAESLAVRDAVKTRSLIQSSWYQERFNVKLKSDQNQKANYETTEGGYRLSMGVGGGITGQGGDFLIGDDLLKADEAVSDTNRNSVNFWFDNTFQNRLNDPKKGVKIIIGQRLHENDVFGHIFEGNEEWEKIILPAEFENGRYSSKYPELNDPRKEEGELLWPERLGLEELTPLKVNKLIYSQQYQQRSAPQAGNIYKKEWFSKRIENVDIVARYISWDTASSVDENAAFSSCTVGELTSNYQLFIREVYREKLSFPQLHKAVEELARKYKYKLKGIIIESKSSGISLLQTLAQSSEGWISEILVPFNPKNDKPTRGSLASIWCENGSVLLPPYNEIYPWLFDFEEELFQFPNSKYKDQVDSFNQLILYLENYLSAGFRSRT